MSDIRPLAMSVTVDPARTDERTILRNMVELYRYDLSEIDGRSLNPHGLYEYAYLDHYWTEDERHPFLVRVDGELAGFVLVNTLGLENMPGSRISEFFVLRKFRTSGIGEEVARRIFAMFPGQWNVEHAESNPAAHQFWPKVIERITGGDFTVMYNEESGHHLHQFQIMAETKV